MLAQSARVDNTGAQAMNQYNRSCLYQGSQNTITHFPTGSLTNEDGQKAPKSTSNTHSQAGLSLMQP